MLERIQKFKTVEECETFAQNARERGHPDFALAANRRKIEIRAGMSGAVGSGVEWECFAAIAAYEDSLAHRQGKKRVHASRTWPMVKRYGIIEAVERIVRRRDVTAGYATLLEMGLQDYAFEAVVCRYPESFSKEAFQNCEQRVASWSSTL